MSCRNRTDPDFDHMQIFFIESKRMQLFFITSVLFRNVSIMLKAMLVDLLCAMLNAAAFGCAVYATVKLASGDFRDRMIAVSVILFIFFIAK